MLIYVAGLNPRVGDISQNSKKILESIDIAREKEADILLFAESSLSGYPAEDLLLYNSFLEEIKENEKKIIKASKDLFIVLGTIRKNKNKGKPLFNTACIINNQKVLGYKDKTLLPTYDVFDERRYFEVGKKQKVFKYKNKKIGVLICEDAWIDSDENTQYDIDPVTDLKKLNPDLVLVLSASPYYFQKLEKRVEIYSKAAKKLNVPLIVANQVGANDQLVFDGYSMYFDSSGNLLDISKGFVEDHLLIDTDLKYKKKEINIDPVQDLYSALVLGVKDYFIKQKLTKALIGLSGGIDSALVLCIAKDALGSENVLAVNMPSRFSSSSSIEDSHLLAGNLKIKVEDIPIDNMFQNYLDLLQPYFLKKPFDTTEENIQARIRGMILMALSNKLGYIVLSTGNKSEIAIGYVTLYGDMCGGLGVLNDVTKTLIYKLARWINRQNEIIPKSIIEKEPSAELKKNQKDSDTLPSYDIIDKVLQGYVEDHLSIEKISEKHSIESSVVKDLIKKIHLAEYKRRQAPPGIRVSKKAFTKGRYLPIVQGWI